MHASLQSQRSAADYAQVGCLIKPSAQPGLCRLAPYPPPPGARAGPPPHTPHPTPPHHRAAVQEAIKLITQQFVPVGGVLLYNGMAETTSVFNF